MATNTTQFGQGNIDPHRWDRLKTILGEALEQNSSAARIALVERRCGETSQKRRVRKLLKNWSGREDSNLRPPGPEFNLCCVIE